MKINWLNDNYFTPVNSYPRPDWNKIEKKIQEESPSEDLDEIWSDIAYQWVIAVKSTLPANYHIYDNSYFILLTAETPKYAKSILEILEYSRRTILNSLRGIASDEGYGKHVVMVFETHEQYYSYISYFYPDEGEFAISSGVYLNNGYGHFVFPHHEIAYAEAVATHELCHALLSHLPLPLWLDEGITVNIEGKIIAQRERPMDRWMVEEHLAFWNEKKIQEFWTGRSFSRPDEGQDLSYHLAHFLVQSLARDFQSFKQFVLQAHFEDGGESAARAVYNNTLGYLIEGVLGEGEWSPKR